jgi:hypothetical protein
MDPVTMALIYGGGKALQSLGDAYGAEKKRKSEKRRISGQLSALNNLAEITPSERGYVQRRRDIMSSGDPLLNQEFNRQVGTIRQQGVFNRQRAQGQAIQQGLEGSIVAQELRRKVDQDVLTSVAEQARQLALANAKAKRTAESELESMNMKLDARKQDIAYRKGMLKADSDALGGYGWEDRLMTLANMGTSFADGYTKFAGGKSGYGKGEEIT